VCVAWASMCSTYRRLGTLEIPYGLSARSRDIKGSVVHSRAATFRGRSELREHVKRLHGIP